MPGAAPRPQRTHQAKPTDPKGWWIADMEGKTLGRAASRIASVLRGKHRPDFTTYEDAGDFVVVINADKIKLTGRKWDQKMYHDHSLHPGGLKSYPAKTMIQRHPEDLVKRAIKGMLPKGPLGRRIYKKLKVYASAEHPHAAQQPKPLTLP